METQISTEAERKAWWSARRRRYNIALFIAAPISAVFLLTVWGLFEERLPCLEITGVSIIFGGILFLVGVGLANICYFLGPLSERLIRPRNAFTFRRWVYGAGVAFSLLLIFSPPILNLLGALLGSECIDKFGERHTVGSVSSPSLPYRGADDANAVGVVAAYVSETHKWPRETYRIELNRRDENVLTFWVIHRDDETSWKRSHVAGGGRSFAVEYDVRSQRVVRELGFQ